MGYMMVGLGAKKKAGAQALKARGPAALSTIVAPSAASPLAVAPAAATAEVASLQARQEANRASEAAKDEWKRYLASLKSLDMNLRNGSLPPDASIPSAPSYPSSMAPAIYRQAMDVLQKRLPVAYEIARNLDRAKGVRLATSSYAAGQPAVTPSQDQVYGSIPSGDLPGQVQQVVTDAFGSDPVLALQPPSQTTVPSRSFAEGGEGGGLGKIVKPLAIAAGVGLVGWLAWKAIRRK